MFLSFFLSLSLSLQLNRRSFSIPIKKDDFYTQLINSIVFELFRRK